MNPIKNIQERITDSFNAQGLMAMLGARLVSVAEGEVQIELPFSPTLTQQQGFLHAGAITSILDSACGYAALTKAPEGHEVLTVEFKINFMRPVIGERFVASGRVLNAGRLLTVCTGEVRALAGGESKLIAVMQATVVSSSRLPESHRSRLPKS